MKVLYNNKNKEQKVDIKNFSLQKAQEVCEFHKSFPNYNQTDLVELKNLAIKNGVKDIYVKDESTRFGLNSFKVLGGSYAIAKELQKILGIESSVLSYGEITSKKYHDIVKKMTFVSATDGNHGRGVAAMAQELGANAIIYMPKGSAKERYDNIVKTGAKCIITDCNYDDSVRIATQIAQENNWIYVQDTAFGDYQDIPLHIMQGYMTMAYEAYKSLGDTVPTHIFLQAGVGSMAGAVTAFFANAYKDKMPKIIIVEPNNAGCIFKTAKANDGKLHYVKGELKTIMAGLSCGEPCSIAFKILNVYASAFTKVADSVAKNGMRTLAYPIGNDKKIVSGESGAAGIGTVLEILKHEPEVKKKLGINSKSVILCFSTEGDTDKQSYNKIVNKK